MMRFYYYKLNQLDDIEFDDKKNKRQKNKTFKIKLFYDA